MIAAALGQEPPRAQHTKHADDSKLDHQKGGRVEQPRYRVVAQ